MEEVAITDTASQFVETINDNFEELEISSSMTYSSSGSDFINSLNEKFIRLDNPVNVNNTGENIVLKINTNFRNFTPITPGQTTTVTMNMQIGALDNGYSKNYESRLDSEDPVDNDIWKYCHSAEMIDIGVGTNPIQSVTLFNGETLSIYWFNSDLSQSGSVSSVSEIPSAARYIRFQISSSSVIPPNRILSVTVTDEVRKIKNFIHKQYASNNDNRTYITYEVKQHAKLTTGVDYFNNERIYDNGYIVLPSSYQPNGTKTNLAVFIPGTGGYKFVNGKTDSTYRQPNTFIAQNNIAVCCCSGLTSRYPNHTNLMYGPMFCESVASMVDYIKANYNIGKIYLYGKSSGGMLTNFAPLVEQIEAVCVGSLAPAFCPIISQAYHQTYNSKPANAAAEQIGVDYIFTGAWNTADKNAVTGSANIQKWINIDSFFQPYLKNNVLTASQIADIANESYAIVAADASVNKKSIYYVVTESTNTTIKEYITKKMRPFPVPHKVWCAPDDEWVTYGGCDVLCRYSRNYTLSTLDENTGGHNADFGTSATKTQYTLPNGNIVTISTAYAELVDWFKCDGIVNNN